MIICVCRSVSDRDIAREAAAGCADFATLQQRLGVSTGCGVCREFAEDAWAEAQHRCGAGCAGRCPVPPQPQPMVLAAA